jgi:hypothetical protein
LNLDSDSHQQEAAVNLLERPEPCADPAVLKDIVKTTMRVWDAAKPAAPFVAGKISARGHAQGSIDQVTTD